MNKKNKVKITTVIRFIMTIFNITVQSEKDRCSNNKYITFTYNYYFCHH